MIAGTIGGAMGGLRLLVAPLLMSISTSMSGPISVQGTSDCPSPAAVAALLPGVLTPAPRAEEQTAVIDAAGADVAITIRGPDGSIRLTRRLRREDLSRPACSAMAAAVAVVIATWQIEQNAELSLLQPGVYPRAPAASESFREVPAPPPGTTTTGGATLFAGAAVGATIGGWGLIGTVQGQLEWDARSGRNGVWLALAADGQGQVAQAGGTSTWRRMTAGLGPWWALGHGLVRAQIGGQVFVGRTTVEGSGFATDRNDHAISLGLTGIARLVGPGSVQPYVEAGARGWLAPQAIEVLTPGQPDSRAALPRLEGRLTVGVQFQLGT